MTDGTLRNAPLGIAKELILLERGDGELLLANSRNLHPLYIPRGGGYVRRFLEALPRLGTVERVNEAFPSDVELLAMLEEHRIVVPAGTGTDEPIPAPPGVEPKWENKASISLYLLLSQSCNLACVYCLNGKETYRKGHGLKMDDAVAFRSLERCLSALAPDGVLEVVFFGGEPLLNWPLAKRTILHCEALLSREQAGKRVRYSLTSNLTRLPSDLLEWAKRHDIGFLCDVDGPPALHDRSRPYPGGGGSHGRTAANIRRIVDAGMKVALRATVTSMNHDCMVETAAHHKALGASGSAFVPLNPVNSDEDILSDSLLPDPDLMIEGLEKVYRSGLWSTSSLFPFSIFASRVSPGARCVTGCGAPCGNTPVVDASGAAYPCIYLVGIGKYHLGRVTDDSFPDRDVLDRMECSLHVDKMEECMECPWRYLCGGGCPVGRLTVYGNPRATPKALDYVRRVNCDYTKKILELLLWEKATEAGLSAAGTPGDGAGAVAIDSRHC